MVDKLTHIDGEGAAHMVDVSDKASSKREAQVSGYIKMQEATLSAILSGNMKKGDVLGTARLAGIMAAKRTHELIPLCHQILLSKIDVSIKADEALPGLRVLATARCTGQTGVEMEAFTAASVACLTLYDMAKALDRRMEIGGLTLETKSGGKSDDFVRSKT